jgi:ribosomal protein S25
MSETKIVKKKKKWGKTTSYNSIKRAQTIDEAKMKEIEAALKKKGSVFTPTTFASQQEITVSLAKKLLEFQVEAGKLEIVYKKSGNLMYKN